MIDEKLHKNSKRYRESFIKQILNKLLVLLLKFISILPFWAIYGIADLFYVIVRYIFGYRKKVILNNLRNSFPEKSEDEIKKIMASYYHHFCDFSLETIKMHGMSEKKLRERFKVTGMDEINKYAGQGKNIVTLGMHYNNWEWCSALQLDSVYKTLMIYNPMRGNLEFEKFLLQSREKWGGLSVPIHKSARTLIEHIQKGIPVTTWLCADQTPGENSPFWTIFLNQEAPFFQGPEKIAYKNNQPVVFLHVKKTKRGHYEAVVSVLIEEPQKIEPHEILLRYVKKMEEIIREEPAYYLWSHRRWKHKRPDGIELTV